MYQWVSQGFVINRASYNCYFEGDVFYDEDIKTKIDDIRRSFTPESYQLAEYRNPQTSITFPHLLDDKKIVAIESNILQNNPTYSYTHRLNTNHVTSIHIEEGIVCLGDYAFNGMKNVTDIFLPESLRLIGSYCFSHTPIPDISLPQNLIHIPSGLFNWCVNLRKIVIPEKVKYIGQVSFAGCASLSTVKFGNHVKVIKHRAFSNSGLEFISLPESLERIEEGAFENCRKLEGCYIPKNVEYIADDAFVLRIDDEDCHSPKVRNPNLTIFTEFGSYAYQWAYKKGYRVAVRE